MNDRLEKREMWVMWCTFDYMDSILGDGPCEFRFSSFHSLFEKFREFRCHIFLDVESRSGRICQEFMFSWRFNFRLLILWY